MGRIITQVKFAAAIALMLLAIALYSSRYATPDFGFVYQLKRLQENVFQKLKFSPMEEVEYQSMILDKRLSELKSLVEREQNGYFLSSSSRYSTTAGRLSEMIWKNYLPDQVSKIFNQFQDHRKVIEGLIKKCRENDNTECKYLVDDLNYLKIYSDKLSQKM